MAGAKADYSDVPTVVFSHPPIGTVGLTEQEAVDKYGKDNIKVYTSTFTNLYYGTFAMEPDQKPKTAMKLVTLLPTEKVLGVHSIGKLLVFEAIYLIISLVYKSLFIPCCCRDGFGRAAAGLRRRDEDGGDQSRLRQLRGHPSYGRRRIGDYGSLGNGTSFCEVRMFLLYC